MVKIVTNMNRMLRMVINKDEQERTTGQSEEQKMSPRKTSEEND